MLLTPVLSLSSYSIIPLFFYIMSAHHEVFVFSKKQALPHSYRNVFSLSLSLFPSLPLPLSLTHTHTSTCACLHTYTHCGVRTNTHARRQSAVPFPQLVARKQNTLPVPASHTYTHTCAHTNSATALYTLLKGHDTDLYIATESQQHTWTLHEHLQQL